MNLNGRELATVNAVAAFHRWGRLLLSSWWTSTQCWQSTEVSTSHDFRTSAYWVTPIAE
jgi:hypothetical protein